MSAEVEVMTRAMRGGAIDLRITARLIPVPDICQHLRFPTARVICVPRDVSPRGDQ